MEIDSQVWDVESIQQGLAATGYLADDEIAAVTFLAMELDKPILVEGPAGTGKTQLAKSVAQLTQRRLIRLQCYEGLDESKILYEWNYKKQLLRIQAQAVLGDQNDLSWRSVEEDIFGEEFLLSRPVLESLRSPEPVVLLIDEIDRVEIETEAMLLEVLSEYQVSIPEMGTVSARHIPMVFLTSNDSRELSDALKRRCLYLHLDYPSVDRERAIISIQVPGIADKLAGEIAELVALLRAFDLKKHPSVSETLDWARSLVKMGAVTVGRAQLESSLNILLKNTKDIAIARESLGGVVG